MGDWVLSEANILRGKREHGERVSANRRASKGEAHETPLAADPIQTRFSLDNPENHLHYPIATTVAAYLKTRSETEPALWEKRVKGLRFKSLHKLVTTDGTMHKFALRAGEMHVEKAPELINDQNGLTLKILASLHKTYPPKMPHK